MKHSNSSQRPKESKYFDEIRNENYDDTFDKTDTWLRNANEKFTNSNSTNSDRKPGFINIILSGNKSKLAYAFLILAFLIAACNYPVTQEESAGDVMKWSVSKDNTEAISQIQNLDWIKNGVVNVIEDGNYIVYSFIIPKEDHNNVTEYNKQLEAITGIDQINIFPLNETVKRPVYSALLNNLFKIDINATNMSDSELSNEISAQLKSAGLEAAQVDFEKDENGNRRVKIFIPVQEIKNDGGFDMTIKRRQQCDQT